jgi:subtilisin family serine protease
VTRISLGLTALAVVIAAGAVPCAGATGPGAGTTVLPGASSAPTAPAGPVSWVVGTGRSAPSRRLERALADAGALVEPLPGLDALTVSGGRRSDLIQILRDARAVTYIEPQLERRLLAEPAEATDATTGRPFSWAFDAVRAAGGISRAGGGAPNNPVAVVDTGVDATHPDLSGRVLAGYDVLGEGSVEDTVGHGTFIAGLISAIDGNGAGGRGVAGATPVIPVRVSAGTGITSADLAAGIVAAVDRGARVINLSIGGPGLSSVESSALEYARKRDVVVVASAGNSGEDGNQIEYPAAAIGGDQGGWSAGLSVGATDPSGQPAPFSTHNRNVSIAAPGAGSGPCTDGVYSTIPVGQASLWPGGPCDRIFTTQGPGRYAYAQGTSFSAPMVAGAAALVRQVGPGLRADQAADVLRRSAVQTRGVGWNEYTGAGVLDIDAATALAARYDTTAPMLSSTTDAATGTVQIRASAEDRTAAGDELAGGVSLGLDYSRDGVTFSPLITPGQAAINQSYAASAAQPLWFHASACDQNRNCVDRTLGPFTGAAPGGARVRTSILAFGIGRRCRPRGLPCVRLVWKSGPPTVGLLKYSIEVREVGTPQLIARAAGSTSVGHRLALNLRLRHPLRCGRIVARLTTTDAKTTQLSIRRLAVRSGCVRRQTRGSGPAR